MGNARSSSKEVPLSYQEASENTRKELLTKQQEIKQLESQLLEIYQKHAPPSPLSPQEAPRNRGNYKLPEEDQKKKFLENLATKQSPHSLSLRSIILNQKDERTYLPEEAEQKRIDMDSLRREDWKKWGPYLSERQWGTVREDYSPNGDCWNFHTFIFFFFC